MEKRRHLPIGLQSFMNVRNRNCVYVDKTRFVWELAQDSHPYFLSRPRRFGKSLLLSTMECYFLAQKDLFKGLEIEKLETEWIEYPVLKISFGGGAFEDDAHLKSYLNHMLSNFENQYGIIPHDENNYSGRLENIMNVAKNKTGKQVVVLIDEYDKPILDAIYTEHEEKNRSILRDFYSPLKDNENSLKFLFITGITKVSHINIFSGLNQLDDISLKKEYATICGISETELEENFQPEIASLAEEQELTVEEAKRLNGTMVTEDHLKLHAANVAACMGAMALHFGEDKEHWEAVGYLHDYDYEKYPEEHLAHTEEPLREAGVPEEDIRAILSHGYGICTDVEPLSAMEKSLFTVDELSGIIQAAARMRPNGITDMEVKSFMKKWKDKKFAAKCDRPLILKGCEMLGMDIKDVSEICIGGMKEHAAELQLTGAEE